MKDHAPSTDRNRDDILAALRDFLPARGTVLEIASGSGQHAAYFAPRLAPLRWQPTDRSERALRSIDAWRQEVGADNLMPPLRLDVTDPRWPVETADAVVAINMLHISPWVSAVALFRGAARVLPPGAPLCTYGAVLREDRTTAPSNLAFDASLRARDPAWGIRDLAALQAAAARAGLALEHAIDMPNNNTTLVFRRAPAASG